MLTASLQFKFLSTEHLNVVVQQLPVIYEIVAFNSFNVWSHKMIKLCNYFLGFFLKFKSLNNKLNKSCPWSLVNLGPYLLFT